MAKKNMLQKKEEAETALQQRRRMFMDDARALFGLAKYFHNDAECKKKAEELKTSIAKLLKAHSARDKLHSPYV